MLIVVSLSNEFRDEFRSFSSCSLRSQTSLSKYYQLKINYVTVFFSFFPCLNLTSVEVADTGRLGTFQVNL
jgi:hypothetical protein